MILRLAGILFIISRIFCHLSEDTAINARIYYSCEAIWQLMFVVGVYVNGLNKSNRIFILCLMPFFTIEFVYTMLHSLFVIELTSYIEKKTVIMIESFLTSILFIYHDYKRTFQK